MTTQTPVVVKDHFSAATEAPGQLQHAGARPADGAGEHGSQKTKKGEGEGTWTPWKAVQERRQKVVTNMVSYLSATQQHTRIPPYVQGMT